MEHEGSERSFSKILSIARNLVRAPAVSKTGPCEGADTESREQVQHHLSPSAPSLYLSSFLCTLLIAVVAESKPRCYVTAQCSVNLPLSL